MTTDPNENNQGAYNLQPFRRAVFRGLGLVLPPLLTFVILLWIANSVEKILTPIESGSRAAMVWFLNKTQTEIPENAEPNPLLEQELAEKVANAAASNGQARPTQPAPTDGDKIQQLIEAVSRIERQLDAESGLFTGGNDSLTDQPKVEANFFFDENVYVRIANGEWIPEHIRDAVEKHVRATATPLASNTGQGYYDHYVKHSILKRSFVIPVFFAGFILLMYLLGKFLAAGVGRYFWNLMESVINQLPIIRTVYSSVKQVTDFFVGESDVGGEFQRVVAVEYPRRGIWSVGFVTGESLLSIRGAAEGEAIVSVLMPTSPVPGTGFTITVRKSETIDLDIPIEQALQFVVSCGVVIPDDEIQDKINSQIKIATAGREFESTGAGAE